MSCGTGCKQKTDAFIAKHMNQLVDAIKGSGIFFATIVAQKTLESGYGESTLAVKHNNYGGVKYGSGVWGATGKTTMDTTEYVNGKLVKKSQDFAVFPDPTTSFLAYIKVLQDPTKKYRKNGVFTATSPDEQIRAIVKSGYTTTPVDKYLDARMKQQIEYVELKYQIGLVK